MSGRDVGSQSVSARRRTILPVQSGNLSGKVEECVNHPHGDLLSRLVVTTQWEYENTQFIRNKNLYVNHLTFKFAIKLSKSTA